MKKSQVLLGIFKKVCFLFTITLFSNCTEKNLSIVLDDKSSTLVYSDSIKVISYVENYLDYLNERKDSNKYEAWQCNSTKIIFSNDYSINKDICETKSRDHEIYIFDITKYSFELDCDKTVEVNSNGVIFMFCYYDILNFIKAKKNLDNTNYSSNNNLLNSFLKFEKNKNIKPKIGEHLLSDLLNNIPFFMKLEKGNKQLNRIEIKNIFTGYSNEVEHYIYDDKNKIVAYFRLLKWIQ